MSFLTMFFNQTCTYWAKNGVDGFNKTTYAAPVQLPCRWEDRAELHQMENGEAIRVGSKVFLPQAVVVDDFLFLGTSNVADPITVQGAYQILDFKRVPSLHADEFENVAFLRRAYF